MVRHGAPFLVASLLIQTWFGMASAPVNQTACLYTSKLLFFLILTICLDPALRLCSTLCLTLLSTLLYFLARPLLSVSL